MLQYDVYVNGAPAESIELAGAYVFGQDGIPVRADLAICGSQIRCTKRVPGACGLALLWDAGLAGKYLLATTRLPDREEPYNLNVELARAQMMQIARKQEDWGLFDYPDAASLNKESDEVRLLFVEALKAREPAEAAKLADEALSKAVTLGEKIALFHAEIFLSRRKVSKTKLGCMVDFLSLTDAHQQRLREVCDFVSIPTPWKHVEPKEQSYQYEYIDAWIDWAARAKKAVCAGPLLSFGPTQLPEWLYIWEKDYDALRDVIYEHIQRVVGRYGRRVGMWNIVSGIHAHNNFNLSFEQLMELTRMSCLLVKKLAPKSKAMIELSMPWGEYYARNQRTIPPLLYADMAVQSGIKFDAFGLQICLGVPVDGFYVRDLMQVSSLMDEFVGFGKPVHITACQVPSDTTPDTWDAWAGKAPTDKAGHWHAPWSQRLQAEWLSAFYRVGVSKPFVESLCWRDLADYEGHYIPHGGLCQNDMEPKLAYKELRNFKAFLVAGNSSTDNAGGGDHSGDNVSAEHP